MQRNAKVTYNMAWRPSDLLSASCQHHGSVSVLPREPFRPYFAIPDKIVFLPLMRYKQCAVHATYSWTSEQSRLIHDTAGETLLIRS
jgi:hypothetical protein